MCMYMLIIVRHYYICAKHFLKIRNYKHFFENPYALGSAYYELSYYEYSGYKSCFFFSERKTLTSMFKKFSFKEYHLQLIHYGISKGQVSVFMGI